MESFEPRPKVLIASAVPTPTTCGSHVLVPSAIAQGMSLRIGELRTRRLLRPHSHQKAKKPAARVADTQAQARIGGGGCELRSNGSRLESAFRFLICRNRRRSAPQLRRRISCGGNGHATGTSCAQSTADRRLKRTKPAISIKGRHRPIGLLRCKGDHPAAFESEDVVGR